MEYEQEPLPGMGQRSQVLTNSEVQCWQECPHKWRLRYHELLRPPLRVDAASFGTLYHVGVAAGWRALKDGNSDVEGCSLDAVAIAAAQRLSEIQEAAIEDESVSLEQLEASQTEQMEAVMWSVQHYWRHADRSHWPVMVEETFRVPFLNSRGHPRQRQWWAGQIDLVTWDPANHRLVLHEHKTTSFDVQSFERRIRLDSQVIGYTMALRWMHRQGRFQQFDVKRSELGAVVWNLVRSRRPGIPKVNLLKKSETSLPKHHTMLVDQKADGLPRGRVSVAQIDTLPSLYREALEIQEQQRGLARTPEQNALLERLEARGDVYFQQVEHFVTGEELERWRSEVRIEARRMRDAERYSEKATRHPGSCTLPWTPGCSYREVCLQDVPETRALYRVATTRHEELDNGSTCTNGGSSVATGQE